MSFFKQGLVYIVSNSLSYPLVSPKFRPTREFLGEFLSVCLGDWIFVMRTSVRTSCIGWPDDLDLKWEVSIKVGIALKANLGSPSWLPSQLVRLDSSFLNHLGSRETRQNSWRYSLVSVSAILWTYCFTVMCNFLFGPVLGLGFPTIRKAWCMNMG